MSTTLDEIRTLRRKRELASDHRAGQWARTKARTAQREYARTHWKPLTTAFVVGVALIAGAVLLIPSSFLRGLVLGAGIAGILGFLGSWVVQTTGTAPAMMGDLGEQWSARELRSLNGQGWRVINQLKLRPHRDIDHVLVGPGGAYAVETKWRAESWQLNPADDRVLLAAKQARANARDLTLWSAFRREVGTVEPLVILWGRLAEGSPHMAAVDGTTVISGHALDRWRESLSDDRLSNDNVEAAWQLLDDHVRLRDGRVESPVPESFLRMGMTVVFGVVTGCVAGYLAAGSLYLTRSLWWAALACAVLGCLAIPVFRWKPSRSYAIGWATGIAGVVAVALAAYLLAIA